MDYDQLAREYARNRHLHPAVLQALLQCPLPADGCLLEVGCGTGNYLAALTQATGCAGWGIDPSESMLAHARHNAPGASFERARAERLPYPQASFDLIFSVDVIHHVAERAAYFQEARRALRPGGWLCTVTDSEWVIRHRQPLSEYFPETVAVELARYPAIETLRAEMQAAGFTQLREELVEDRYALTDIQPFREKAYSSLHLITDEAFQAGLARMQADLQRGPIQAVPRYTLLWGSPD